MLGVMTMVSVVTCGRCGKCKVRTKEENVARCSCPCNYGYPLLIRHVRSVDGGKHGSPRGKCGKCKVQERKIKNSKELLLWKSACKEKCKEWRRW